LLAYHAYSFLCIQVVFTGTVAVSILTHQANTAMHTMRELEVPGRLKLRDMNQWHNQKYRGGNCETWNQRHKNMQGWTLRHKLLWTAQTTLYCNYGGILCCSVLSWSA